MTGEHLFVGELMTCLYCGTQEQHPGAGIHSMWKGIELSDGRCFYVCPKDFPENVTDGKKYERASKRFMNRVAENLGGFVESYGTQGLSSANENQERSN
jgi:hypothetical protein